MLHDRQNAEESARIIDEFITSGTLGDAKVALRRGSEDPPRCFVYGTVIRRYRFFETVELRDDDALIHAGFTRLNFGRPY